MFHEKKPAAVRPCAPAGRVCIHRKPDRPRGGTPAVSPSEEPGLTAGAPEKMTCRIVDGAEEGELVLAGPGGAGDVYTLDTEGLAVDGPLADGRWWRSGLTE